MNILVVGGNGTIGIPLVIRLQKLGHVVFCADRQRDQLGETLLCDVHNYETLHKAFQVSKPEIVILLAGEVSRMTCESMPGIALESNVIGVQHVIDLCLQYKSKLIFSGTSEEYGNCFDNGTYVTEDMIPTHHNGIYGLSKWIAEELIKYYSTKYKLNAIVLRLFMCYGPGEYPSPYRSAISRFIGDALMNRDIIVHRDTERSWCYISDIVEGIVSATFYDKSRYEVFNIGITQPYSMYILAEIIKTLTHSNSQIVEEECPSGIIPVKRGNFDKAEKLLNWKANVCITAGLKQTIEWTKQNMKG